MLTIISIKTCNNEIKPNSLTRFSFVIFTSRLNSLSVAAAVSTRTQ